MCNPFLLSSFWDTSVIPCSSKILISNFLLNYQWRGVERMNYRYFKKQRGAFNSTPFPDRLLVPVYTWIHNPGMELAPKTLWPTGKTPTNLTILTYDVNAPAIMQRCMPFSLAVHLSRNSSQNEIHQKRNILKSQLDICIGHEPESSLHVKYLISLFIL